MEKSTLLEINSCIVSCNIDVCSAETLLSAKLYFEYMRPSGWYIFSVFLSYCSMCWCSVAYKLLWPYSPECLDSSTLHSYTLWWNNQFSSKYYKSTPHSPSIGIRYPDSKVHGTLWWNNQFSSRYYKWTSHSPCIRLRYPDSKVRGTLWWNNQFSSKYYKWTSHSPSIGLRYPDSKVHGANIGHIWGRQDPDGPHVGPMKLAIWVWLLLVSARSESVFY